MYGITTPTTEMRVPERAREREGQDLGSPQRNTHKATPRSLVTVRMGEDAPVKRYEKLHLGDVILASVWLYADVSAVLTSSYASADIVSVTSAYCGFTQNGTSGLELSTIVCPSKLALVADIRDQLQCWLGGRWVGAARLPWTQTQRQRWRTRRRQACKVTSASEYGETLSRARVSSRFRILGLTPTA